MNNTGVINPFLERKKEIEYLVVGEGPTEKNYFMALNKKTNRSIKIIWVKPNLLSTYSDVDSIYAISQIMFSSNFEIEKMNVKHWKTIVFMWVESIDSTTICKIKDYIRNYIKSVNLNEEITLHEFILKHNNIFKYMDNILNEVKIEKLLISYLKSNTGKKIYDNEISIVKVIVLDLDYSESRYNGIKKLIKKSKEFKWRLILTNPCIELWFILHIVQWDAAMKLELDNLPLKNMSSRMCEISNQILDDNNEFRNNNNPKQYKDKIWNYDTMISYSKKAIENIENSKLKTELSSIINEYGTNIQYLVNEILYIEERK